MADQSVLAEAVARPLIEQCRREIAAAWMQVEAAREGLRRGRWLLSRWTERSRIDEPNEEEARLNSSDRSEAARIGMFVLAEPDTYRHRRHRGRSGRLPLIILSRPVAHTRPRSASG
jgi:hypothetical protein